MTPAVTPAWMTAFLDFSAATYDAGVAFWSAATGYPLSPSRGDEDEFATLLPPDGDAYLRVQRLGSGGDRVHLDLHVDDPRAAADRATGLGAHEVEDRGHVLMASPGGFPFCFVPGGPGERPAPWTRVGGSAALLDQVCLDVPPGSFDAECDFWSALTGWEQARSAVSGDFRPLLRPPAQPLRILLQRLGADDPGDATRAHLDWACTDRGAETERHVGLGATVEAVRHHWTVLVDPTGRRYCLTERDPGSGLLPDPARTVTP